MVIAVIFAIVIIFIFDSPKKAFVKASKKFSDASVHNIMCSPPPPTC